MNKLLQQNHIFLAKTMHKRCQPRENKFVYKLYYLFCPLRQLNSLRYKALLQYNKFALLSIRDKDHGDKSADQPLASWIKQILTKYDLLTDVREICLLTLPNVMGYVFNPVSFWLCYNNSSELIAVVCEVNNTFGEHHSYLIYNSNKNSLNDNNDDELITEKVFHVSPFFTRNGYYKFKFQQQGVILKIYIDYYNEEDQLLLQTSLCGKMIPLNYKNLLRTIARYPHITLLTIMLIHYQAIKLVLKKIKYINKPQQFSNKLTINNKT